MLTLKTVNEVFLKKSLVLFCRKTIKEIIEKLRFIKIYHYEKINLKGISEVLSEMKDIRNI